jgi:hypothetical protein
MRFDVDTKAAPEQVRRALTDFTDHRLQIWNRTLDPKKYELREQGETWAVGPGAGFVAMGARRCGGHPVCHRPGRAEQTAARAATSSPP